MSDRLKTILNYQRMTKFVTTGADGVPNALAALGANNPLSLTRRVDGDQAAWDIFANSRQAAPVSSYGSKSVARQKARVDTRSAKMIHTFTNTATPMSDLTSIRRAGSNDLDQRGVEELGRIGIIRGTECMNLRLQALYSMLRYGALYLRNQANGNGSGFEILPSSTNATMTIDFGVPAGNIVESPSWNWHTGTPDIAGNVANLSAANVAAGNPPIRLAIYGRNVAGYLRNEATIGRLIQSQTRRISDTIADGGIPDVYGLLWVPADTVFLEDPTGTQTRWFDDRVVFCPMFSRDWFEFHEGSFLVPAEGASDTGRVESAVDGFDTAYGMFSYAKKDADPPSIIQYFGDTFLPVAYVPSNIYSYKVNA